VEGDNLPEALGPGCAFLDFDNDGWMDLYLVSRGACDFFQPRKPLRNALYIREVREGTDIARSLGKG
jgi:hypothetical protein